jgi:hypothetical protein
MLACVLARVRSAVQRIEMMPNVPLAGAKKGPPLKEGENSSRACLVRLLHDCCSRKQHSMAVCRRAQLVNLEVVVLSRVGSLSPQTASATKLLAWTIDLCTLE